MCACFESGRSLPEARTPDAAPEVRGAPPDPFAHWTIIAVDHPSLGLDSLSDPADEFLRVMPRQIAPHIGNAKLVRPEHTAMPGDQRTLFVNEHRVGEAKFADRGSDLRYLARPYECEHFGRTGSADR